MRSYKTFGLNERKTIQVKRKYGVHAPTNVGANAPVRQTILGFISEKGSCCKADLSEFIRSANEESGRRTNPQWIKKNAKYLVTFEQDGETHYKLSKLGKRVIKATTVNESINDYVEEIGDLEEFIYNNGDMRTVSTWEGEADDMMNGRDTWDQLDEPTLISAIDVAKSFIKKYRIKESYSTLDHDIVMSVLDAAAQYSSEAHYAADQQWDSFEELVTYVKGDFIPKKYQKDFDKSMERIKQRHGIKESLLEGTTPTFKALMKRAKALGIETVSELEDLIGDEFDGAEPHISGADFEIAKKKLRLEESTNEGKTINLTKLFKLAKKAGNTVLDAKDAIIDLGVDYGDKVPVERVNQILTEYDLTDMLLKESADDDKIMKTPDGGELAIQGYNRHFDEDKTAKDIAKLYSDFVKKVEKTHNIEVSFGSIFIQPN